jgi:hypothetical protein
MLLPLRKEQQWSSGAAEEQQIGVQQQQRSGVQQQQRSGVQQQRRSDRAPVPTTVFGLL